MYLPDLRIAISGMTGNRTSSIRKEALDYLGLMSPQLTSTAAYKRQTSSNKADRAG